MARAESITFEEFRTRFSTEEICWAELFRLRYPNGFVCPKCGCTEYYPVRGRNTFQCRACRVLNRPSLYYHFPQARSIGTTGRTGQPLGARGAAAPLFPKESREKPFEGVSLGNFFPAARHGASLRS